jgi:anthranilate phosphoribosyltransferase
MVLANAAAGLLAAEKLTEPEAAVAHAAAALDSGAVQSLLQDLVRLTNA